MRLLNSSLQNNRKVKMKKIFFALIIFIIIFTVSCNSQPTTEATNTATTTTEEEIQDPDVYYSEASTYGIVIEDTEIYYARVEESIESTNYGSGTGFSIEGELTTEDVNIDTSSWTESTEGTLAATKYKSDDNSIILYLFTYEETQYLVETLEAVDTADELKTLTATWTDIQGTVSISDGYENLDTTSLYYYTNDDGVFYKYVYNI